MHSPGISNHGILLWDVVTVIFFRALQVHDGISGSRGIYEYHDLYQIQALEGSGRYLLV